MVTQVRGEEDVGSGIARGAKQAVAGAAGDGDGLDGGVEVSSDEEAGAESGSATATAAAKSRSRVGCSSLPTRPIPWVGSFGLGCSGAAPSNPTAAARAAATPP